MTKKRTISSDDLVSQVVSQQGVRFIREFLRAAQKSNDDIRIGVTRAEVIDNLRTAIAANLISEAQLHEWIRDVEGWGNQHAYLYSLGPEFLRPALWKPERIRKMNAARVFTWGTSVDLSFPDDLKPARLYSDGNTFEAVWQRGAETRKRTQDRDPPNRIIDGDVYEYHAHRLVPLRAVVRFVAVRAKKAAALFVQLPLGQEHNDARTQVMTTLQPILPVNALVPLDISAIVKALDQASLDGSGEQFTSRKARFASGGGSIEFEAPDLPSVWDIGPLRDTRRAMQLQNFDAPSGRFSARLHAGSSQQRDVVLTMDHRERRIYIQAQLTAVEVWSLLDALRVHG